jgi:putative transposase
VNAEHGLTIERMTELARLSRASYYRFERRPESPAADMDLRDAIQRIALQWPSYGRRRVTHELRRRGWTVNAKRVYRLMREDNLLCVRKRKFVLTTDSHHGRKVYPNLARQMVLTDVDQLWVADITYIRLQEEFVFLAVILDAFSRRVIGWALDRHMEGDLTLSALRMALSHRVIEAGLVHHSDRGSQYASIDYTDLLKHHGIAISMSRKGNPWDNAACESFIKTLKYEEVHRSEYRDLAGARSEIHTFLEKIYNRRRLHSALGYMPPAEFESNLFARKKDAAARQLAG